MTKSEDKNLGINLTQGNIPGLILKFFIPFLLANLLNGLYNTVDTVIIGQYLGSSGIVSTATAGRILQLFTYVAVALASGGQTVISQLIGAGKYDELNETIGTMLTELVVMAAVFGAACAFLASDIIAWLNTPVESFEGARQYLIITSCGLPLVFGYNAVSSILRGMGDSRRPLVFIAIATGVNVAGDIVLVWAFGLGVAGTAIATVGAQGIAFICSLVYLYVKREKFGFDFKLRSFAVKWDKLKVMLRIGLPMALREVLLVSAKLVITGYMNLYNPVEIAAYNICDKFYSFSNIFAFSTKQAAGTMVAQNIGAGKKERVKLIVRDTLIMNMIAAGVLCTLAFVIPKQIFGIFTSEADVIACAPLYMMIECIAFVFSGLGGPYDSVVVGTGNSGLGFLTGIVDGVILRVGLGILLGIVADMGVVGVFLSDGLARVGSTAIVAIYYYSGAWKSRKKLIE